MNAISRTTFFKLAALVLAVAAVMSAANARAAEPNRVLLIVMDGLRPDYVTRGRMPNLSALAKRGVFFEDHHSVFPTVTRVNAASIATGSYPAAHGLIGNTVYFPEVEPKRGLSTADAGNLAKIETATGGKLLTAPSIGELLGAAGKKILVVSAGSSGSSFLLNHKLKGFGVINVSRSQPEAVAARAAGALGPPPAEAEPNAGQNKWAVDAYLKFGLGEDAPDAAILWLSDPDHTGHKYGIGEAKTEESIRLVDAELGRIVDTLKEKRLLNQTDILVTSDHGFSTHKGGANLSALLVGNQLKAAPDSDDVVIVEGAIYVKGRDKEKIRRIVELLQKTPWVGAIFVERPRPTHPEGFIPGTLSFNSAYLHHERRPDILVSANWTDEKNQNGWAGTTTQIGVAGHGTSSPFDVHNTLVAAGPGFKRGLRNPVPSANVDLAPTILHLLGVAPPDSMDGRVLKEALRGGPDPDDVKVWRRTHRSVKEGEAGLVIELSESSVDGTDYMNFTKITRDSGQ